MYGASGRHDPRLRLRQTAVADDRRTSHLVEVATSRTLPSRGVIIGAGVLFGLPALAALATGHSMAALAAVLTGALMACGLRAPTLTIALYLLAKYLPVVLSYAAPPPLTGSLQGENSTTWGQLVGGFQLSDLVLLGMLAATGVRTATIARRRLRGEATPYPAWLVVPLLLLAGWFLFEVVRNVGQYGLSAPGELRFEYLLLCLPVYLAATAPTGLTQRRILLVILVATVYVPLVLIPAVGAVKGFGVGPLDRYFPAQVSLGLFFGTLALVVCAARRALDVPRWLLGLTVALAGTSILLDSHRSVWLAGAVAVAVVFALRAVPRDAYRRLGPVVALAVVVAIGASWVLLATQHSRVGTRQDVPAGTASQGDPFSFFEQRARGVVTPSQDQNASWRLEIWKAALPMIRERPLAGEGMGGYWRFEIALSPIPVTVQPHSVYIQTLVKMGIIGLVLLLSVAVAALVFIRRALRSVPPGAPPLQAALLLVGLIALISAFVYSLVYALVDPPLLWIGLACGVAAAGAAEWATRPGLESDQPAA